MWRRNKSSDKVWKEIEEQVAILATEVKKLQELFAELERLENGE